MKISEKKSVEWFLRVALSIGFLSAVADRFGFWPQALSAWGNWDNFVAYTGKLNPWVPGLFIPFVSGISTLLEIVFGVGLLTNFKTSLVAKGAGFLLLIFGLAMALFQNVKAPLDYSVFAGSAAAFALSIMTKK
ncbi:MAG: DoxX family protein [Bacteroidetes bacterium]|nr:DoxX family protein [Bacteroidota bacterium]MBS1540938.1 DoxX family protein [Bacteroidota bacterium]